MFDTSGDILNMSLAIGFIVLVIFLSVLTFYGIVLLRDIAKVADDVRDVTKKVKKSVVEPLRAFDFFVEKTRPYVEMLLEKKAKGKKKKKK